MAACVGGRARRIRTRLAVAGLTVAAMVAVGIGIGPPAGAAAAGGTSRALLTRCTQQVLGIERAAATPAPGSADAQMVSQFGVLRQAPTPLPAMANTGVALASAGVRTYDPSATVRLARIGGSTAVYAVPVTLAVPRLPARCARLPQFAGAGSYLALRALQNGSGPGLCVVGIRREPTVPTGVQLPGRPRRKPRMRPMIDTTTCESAPNLVGYMGTLRSVFSSSAAAQRVLVPDGITALTYTLTDGRRFTAPVAGNLATLPAALTPQGAPHRTSGRGRLLAQLPTTVSETGPNVDPPITLTRPATLVPDIVKSVALLKKLLTATPASRAPAPPSRPHAALAPTAAWR